MSQINNVDQASPNFLSDLNALLNSLKIRKRLSSATHLTPVIILDILERMLHSTRKLPVPAEIRLCQTRTAKVQAMKIFLGILADDLLKVDVLLDRVDPRRLADGEEDEVLYVGELLCWLGKRLRYIPEDPHLPMAGPSRNNVLDNVKDGLSSPSTRSTMTSMFASHSTPSEVETTMTSIMSNTDHESSFDLEMEKSFSSFYEKEDTPSKPWCIHELEFPDLQNSDNKHSRSKAFEESQFNVEEGEGEEPEEDIFSIPRPKIPIRHTGWLRKVDTEREIEQFEAFKRQFAKSSNHSRSSGSSRAFSEKVSEDSSKLKSSGSDSMASVASASASKRTLFLLNERARLLTELAEIQRKYSHDR